MSRISRKELKRDEFVEATKGAEHWLVEHWRLVARIAGALAIVGLAVGGWLWFAAVNREKSAGLLNDGLTAYQRAQEGGFTDIAGLETALEAFDSAARKGGGSAALVARYYRGATLHRLGRGEEAIAALGEVTRSAGTPATLSGSAQALLAEIHREAGERDRAIEILQALVDADPPVFPVDQALVELGKLYREAGDEARAREAWQRVVDEFPVRGGAEEARRLLGS